MKQILLLILFFITIKTNIFSANAQQKISNLNFFAGTYEGIINGEIDASLFLQQEQNNVAGTLNTSGYNYQFVGKIIQNDSINAEGTLIDIQQGSSIPCNISLIGNVLFVHLINTNDQFTTNRNVILFHLDKKTGTTFDKKKFQYLIDEKLVGRWEKQDIVLNGSFSIPTETYMKFNSDGSFETSNYALVVPNESNNLPAQEKIKKETLYGKWIASNNTLYVIPYNSEFITPITKYQMLSDYKLKTNAYDPNGTEEIWNKKAK